MWWYRRSTPTAMIQRRPMRPAALGIAALAVAATAWGLAACTGESTAPAAVPPPLVAAGHFGEGVYDAARAGDWPGVAVTLDSLHRGAAGLASAIAGDGPDERSLLAQLDTLDAAVARRERSATLRSANEVTRLAAELTRPFRLAVPVEITLLDYDGRLLQFWADAGDPARLRASAELLRRTWNAVRPQVERRPGGGTAAQTFDRLVLEAERASPSSDHAAIAQRILDEVDSLERLFAPVEAPD